MAKQENNVKEELMVSPAEFEKIPLEYIIASPLLTTIEAHKVAAMTTLEFIDKLKKEKAEFEVDVKQVDANGNETILKKKINVPLLSMVKVPSLNFDSLSVSFNYSIQQVHKVSKETGGSLEGKIETKGVLKKFVGASFSGSLEKKTNEELTSGRSGNMEIKIHVSESALPAGLQKILDAMVSGIQIDEKTAG
jgi:hypothetical protein